MKLAMVGLGKMGGNITTRLIRGGHSVVVSDLNEDAVKEAVADGAIAATSLADVADKLSGQDGPRIGWVLVPAGAATESVVSKLAEEFSEGDIIVEGGNSYYKDSMRRGELLKEKGIHYVDVGTSGGVWGLDNGYSMMVGGDKEVVEQLRPLFETLAPAADKGWGYVGPSGAGHFVKMVHNGIEYGLMQAYAEGFALMGNKEDFDLDLNAVGKIWQDGSVVRSWLLDLAVNALDENPELDGIAAWVPDSGMGRWTVLESVEQNMSIPVITAALQRRFRSREEEPYGDKLLSALRNQFGGHAIKVDKD